MRRGNWSRRSWPPNGAARTAELNGLIEASKESKDGNPTPHAAEAKEAVNAYRGLLARTVAYGDTVPQDLASVGVTSARQSKISAWLANRMEPKAIATLISHAWLCSKSARSSACWSSA